MTDKRRFDQDRLQEYRKSVHLFGIRKGKFLEFEFTKGCEELTIELVMPYAVFKEFCEVNHVAEITCAASIRADYDRLRGDDNHATNIIQLGDFK